MSVLIKGMEKPEHCGYCRFRYNGICHALQKTQYSMNECPLVVIDDAGLNDTISRQATIDTFYKYPNIDWTTLDVLSKINALPSAQPERKKGEWVYGEHDIAMCDGYWCNQCHFFIPWDYQHKFIDFIKDYNFCPNCGADMRGEQDVKVR